MIEKSYKACRLFNSFSERVTELQKIKITEADWEIRKNFCDFVEPSAQATEIKLGYKYVNPSVTKRNFDRMLKICNMPTLRNYANLITIPHEIMVKFEQ